MNNRKTGGCYEEMAAAYLSENGYEVLTRNYRDRQGEIDIIARDGRYLVFIEVKYRKDDRNGSPAEAVTAGKQKKIIRTARHYLYAHGLGDTQPCRFDVIAILGDEIQLIKDAFC